MAHWPLVDSRRPATMPIDKSDGPFLDDCPSCMRLCPTLLSLPRFSCCTSLVPLGPPRLVREGGESAPREPCTTRQRTRQRTPSHWMTVSAFADVGRCDWLSLTNQWSLSRRVLECWSLTFPKGCVLETVTPDGSVLTCWAFEHCHRSQPGDDHKWWPDQARH